MEMDLASFPPAGRTERTPAEPAGAAPEPQALPDGEALDRYCYHVAGCVGEFWTDLAAAHLRSLAGLDLPAMRLLGIRFGKGLQMTNVLRDLPRDLRMGRCYVPQSLLEAEGLRAADLRGGGSPEAPLPDRLLPPLAQLLDLTLEHYRSGWEYTLAIPPREARLRLACAWPLLIGLSTLALLRARSRDLLRGALLKIPRGRVWRIVVASGLRFFSDRGLDASYRKLEAGAQGPTPVEATAAPSRRAKRFMG
jgi:farnesyl-diphosphate farnesyltransferase